LFFNVTIFWDIASCSTYVNLRFEGTYHLHLQGRKLAEQETSVQQVPEPWIWKWQAPPKRRFMYALHSAISQKMEIFIITSVRTSNRTSTKWFFKSVYSNVTSMQWMSVKVTEIFKILKNILDKYMSAIGVAFLFLVGRGRCWKAHNAEVRIKTDPMIRDCRVTGLLTERSDLDSLQGTRHPSSICDPFSLLCNS
jgi:hypothetical protein